MKSPGINETRKIQADDDSEKKQRRIFLKLMPVLVLFFLAAGFLVGFAMSLNKGIAVICLWFGIMVIPLSAFVLLVSLVTGFMKRIRTYSLGLAAFILAFYGGLASALYIW